MIRRPPRSTLDRSSAASDVYKRQRQGSTSNTFWRQADDARARRAWDAIDRHDVAHFEITPDDFYSNNGGDAILPCTEVVPVIKTMEVYVVRPGADADNGTL